MTGERQLRWDWSDRTRQSKTGWHDTPEGAWLVARVSSYSGGIYRATISSLGADQPLTGTYSSWGDAIDAVEAWLLEHPEQLDHDASGKSKRRR